MNCQTFQSQIERYFHSDLHHHELKDFELHLIACPACQNALAQERAIEGLLKKHLHPMEAPQDLRESVAAAIGKKSEERPLQNVFSVLVHPAWVSAVMVVIVFSVVLFSSHPSIYMQAEQQHQKRLAKLPNIAIQENDMPRLLALLSQELGYDVQRPHLNLSKVHLLGAEIADFNGRKIAHFMYEKDGQIISAYEVPTDIIQTAGFDGEVMFDGEQERVIAASEKGFEDILCLHKQTKDGCLFVSNIPRGEFIKLMG